jgi:ribosomal protein L1
MAKDKSKDELKGDLAEKETAKRTASEAKEAETAEAVIPIAENPKATKAAKNVKKRGTKSETQDQLEETQLESDSGKEAITKELEEKDGGIQESGETTSEADEKGEVKTAKAGKRSAKALKEAEEKQAKETRKAAAETDEAEKPKQPQKPARPKLERKGKKFQKAAEQIDKNKVYKLTEALDLAIKTSPVKFDATVEMHVRLGVNPKHADQNLRDIVVLPSGTGKTIRVAVFADDENIAAAKKAGADIAGTEEILQNLDKGSINFDILIATPATMPKLGKYAKVLGPKGLMPNPKSGTVANDVVKAVQEAKAGRVEYRVDGTGIVHVGIGKVSFGKDKLLVNAQAIAKSLKAAKPASIKGTYVKTVHISTSMGPSVTVENAAIA